MTDDLYMDYLLIRVDGSVGMHVDAVSTHLDTLQRLVNEKIAAGYEPIGRMVVIDGVIYVQTMLRRS